MNSMGKEIFKIFMLGGGKRVSLQGDSNMLLNLLILSLKFFLMILQRMSL